MSVVSFLSRLWQEPFYTVRLWQKPNTEGVGRPLRSSDHANEHFVRVVQHNSGVIMDSAEDAGEAHEHLCHAVRFT